MAYRSVSVYINDYLEENHIRTFGGNGSEVRDMAKLYKNMTKEQFILKHPKFAEKCKERFKLYVDYH